MRTTASFATLRRSTTLAALGGLTLLTLLALTGAGCEGQDAETSDQALVLPTPESIAIDVLKSGAQKALEWWFNDLIGNDPAGDMKRAFDNIDWHLRNIEQNVADLTWVTRKIEVNNVTRLADSDRSMKVSAPLYQAAMFPEMAAGFETQALGVAYTYFQDSFYNFAGTSQTSPDRFDFRAAAPTAVEAVNAWLVFRGIADKYAAPRGQTRHLLDTATRDQLRTFANQLDAKTSAIFANVRCMETRNPIYQKDPSTGGRRAVGCTYNYYCQDKIKETFVYDMPTRQTHGGGCTATSIYRTDPSNNLLATYNPWGLQAVAASWRAIANK